MIRFGTVPEFPKWKWLENKDFILQTKPIPCDSQPLVKISFQHKSAINEKRPMIQLWGTFTLMSNKSLYELAVFCILALQAFPFSNHGYNLYSPLYGLMGVQKRQLGLGFQLRYTFTDEPRQRSEATSIFIFCKRKISLPVSLACVGASMSRSLTLEKTACINML